jgi:hypothetical protein
VFDHDHAASPPAHRLHLVQPLRPARTKTAPAKPAKH